MEKKIRFKRQYLYIFLFLGVFSIIMLCFYATYEKYKKTIVEQQNKQLLVIADMGTKYFKTYVNEKNLEIQNMFTFNFLGKDTDLIERKVEERIKLYWNRSPIYLDYLRYYSLQELNKANIATLPSEDMSIYKKKALQTNELIVGPLVQVNADNMGIYLFKGVFNEYGKYGVIIARINLSMVFHNTIAKIQLGEEGYLTLSDINERFGYYGNREGLYITSSMPTDAKEETCLIGYGFTEVGENNILISARLPYREIEKPIKITFYLFAFLSLGLLLVFAFFTFLLFRIRKKELEYSMELKLQEQIHQGNRNEVLGLFSRKVAHDYNNLLAPIEIYCELLEDSLQTKDPSLLDYVHGIHKSSNQCALLARELLEYGRKKPGEQTMVLFDSNSTIQDAVKRIRFLLPEGISLQTEFQAEPIMLQGQPLELVQIIYNLSMNSIYAMEEAKGNHHVLKISFIKKEDKAVLMVSDTGTGIPKAFQKRIFDSQFTTKAKGGGSGLGLAIVAGIVDNYHGDIKIQSEEEKGCIISITFPL